MIEIGTPCVEGVHEALIQKRWKFIEKHLRGHQYGLDVGCGWGIYSDRLAIHLPLTVGIDIAYVRKGIIASATHIPFARGTFETITCIETLEHIPDYRAALAEMHRVLHPHGVLIVTAPNKRFPFQYHLVDSSTGSQMGTAPLRRLRYVPKETRRVRHLAQEWTPAQMDSLLAESGYSVVARSFLTPTFEHLGLRSSLGRVIGLLERLPFVNTLAGSTIIYACEKRKA